MGRILATELSAFSQAGGSGFKVLGYKMKNIECHKLNTEMLSKIEKFSKLAMNKLCTLLNTGILRNFMSFYFPKVCSISLHKLTMMLKNMEIKVFSFHNE